MKEYIHQEIGKYFTLYFIPVFETKKITDYVECSGCHNSYKTSILEISENIAAINAITSVRTLLEAGMPFEIAAAELSSSGLDKDAGMKSSFPCFKRQNPKMSSLFHPLLW